jgi:cell filamentation protein, protein adenylyltransferase
MTSGFSKYDRKEVTQFIFQDVYPFAGKFRLEDIWKGDTSFCKSQFIEANLNLLLARLAGENWPKGLREDYFVHKAAYYMSELNMIHPFREGLIWIITNCSRSTMLYRVRIII